MKILKFHHIIKHLYFTLIISQIINVFYQLFIIKKQKAWNINIITLSLKKKKQILKTLNY